MEEQEERVVEVFDRCHQEMVQIIERNEDEFKAFRRSLDDLEKDKSLLEEKMKELRLSGKSAEAEKLEERLETQDLKILSMLGICQKINTPWRYLLHCFGEMGLHSLPVEATVGSINAFLQYYGTETPMGLYLRASLKNL